METTEKSKTLEERAIEVLNFVPRMPERCHSPYDAEMQAHGARILIELIRATAREECRRYCTEFFDNIGRYLTCVK